MEEVVAVSAEQVCSDLLRLAAEGRADQLETDLQRERQGSACRGAWAATALQNKCREVWNSAHCIFLAYCI